MPRLWVRARSLCDDSAQTECDSIFVADLEAENLPSATLKRAWRGVRTEPWIKRNKVQCEGLTVAAACAARRADL